MKALITVGLAFASVASTAQTLTFNQIPHIQTALNHLTVIELGEPVVKVEIADRVAFEVERYEDEVSLTPLKSDVSTNLFIWTSTREISYEIDPAGDVAKMTVLLRNAPPQQQHAAVANAGSTEQSREQIQQASALVLAQGLMGSRNITRETLKQPNDGVFVELEQVYRSSDRLYIRYSITNLSKAPFRITAPDISQPEPTQEPVSILSLRDHQLSDQTFSSFKAKPGSTIPVATSESQDKDLAPGRKTIGVISIRGPQGNLPQIYQLHFGNDQSHPVTAEAVL
jgi:hypothetical protein